MSKSKHKFGAQALKTVQGFFPKVEHIKDATEPLVVEVTKEDNKSAAVRKHKNCALAVACKRKTNANGVIVGTRTAYVIEGDTAVRYHLLESTAREIVSFDRNGGFDVGAYTFKAPCKTHRLDTHREPSRNGVKTGQNRHNFRHYTRGIRTVIGSNVKATTNEVNG